VGNPNTHNLSTLPDGPAWLRALGTQSIYTASTVDQMPKQVAAGLMFGTMLSIPVPDVDPCEHLLLGANPPPRGRRAARAGRRTAGAAALERG
jgi:hypothetical protein